MLREHDGKVTTVSGNGGMTSEEVRSEVNRLEVSKKLANQVPAKAIMSGTRLGDRSSAGSEKESGFSRGTKKGKG